MPRTLRRVLPALLTLLLAVMAAVLAAPSAHAAEDEVTSLAVTFDVHADGSVSVRHEIQWRFAETGRHGIDFGIATREPWDQDPNQDVVYEVTDLEVHSPTGAPDQFERTDVESGSTGEIQLRIGDPDTSLETREATYVISYDIRGAMRTFDGVPELHWDVTSTNFPKINEFTVTVTGPDGVDRARCLAGDVECAQSVTDGVATLSGSDVASGDPITAVAAFPEGSVANAEPILEERRLSSSEVSSQDSRFVVDASGMTRVEHTISYRFPQDQTRPESFIYEIPTRLPHSRTEDQVFTLTDVQATDPGGIPYPTTSSEGGDGSALFHRLKVNVTPVDAAATVVLSYNVAGAVGTEDDSSVATFAWPMTHEYLFTAEHTSLQWEVPERIRDVGCRYIDHDGKEARSCQLSGETYDGRTVSLDTSKFKPDVGRTFLVITVPADSVGGVALQLEPSRDLGQVLQVAGGFGGALAALVTAALGVSGIGSLLQRKDHRFVGVPPGVTGTRDAVAATTRKFAVPVRFEPPDEDVVRAGIILDGAYDARHTAAALTQLAVDGAASISTNPLRVVRGDRSLADRAGFTVYAAIPKKPGPRLISEQVRRINQAVNKLQKADLEDRSLFREIKGGCGTRTVFMLIFMLLVPAAALWAAWFGPGDGSLLWSLVLGGVAGGSFFGGLSGLARSGARAPLAAGGTVIRDQIRGFKQYIATAEANQLDSEADQDIFRRYLPWAVLFGLTERWTKVCGELAKAGLIPPLDTSFAGGVSTAELTRGLATLQARSGSAGLRAPSSSSSSSGGSGGSSGFSSSSGGSGGGGTSASSW